MGTLRNNGRIFKSNDQYTYRVYLNLKAFKFMEIYDGFID